MAVSRTARATGRISKLMDSIIIRAGIRGAGEPSGRRCASAEFGCVFKPFNTVASQSGIARAMFIESWVVGVNVYGRRPSVFIKISIVSKAMRRFVHVWPVRFNGVKICFAAPLMIHWKSWDDRLGSRRFVVGISIIGNNTAGVIRGIPSMC